MDEQNNAPQPEEAKATEAAAEITPMPQQEATATQASTPAAQPTQEMPAPQGQPVAQPAVAPTQAMPATQPAAPQPGVDPIIAQQNATYNAEMGAYPPPKPTVALVCGILSIVFAGVIGLILGIIAVIQSNKYFRAGGTEGTGKAGKICGIIGIIVSSIAIVAICALTVFGIAALNEEYTTTSNSLANTTATTSSSSSYSALSDASPEDEAAVYEVVDAELDKLKNLDPSMVASVAALIEESLNDALATENLSLADLQVDSTALATAMLKGFDYEQYYVDASGDEAEANYHVTCKDMYSVLNEFYDQLMDMMDGDLSQYGSMEAAYTAIGQTLMSSVEATPVSDGELFDVDLNKVGGTWVIDQDSWDDEMDYFFGA